MRFAVTERGTFKRCPRQAVLTSNNAEHLTPMFSPLTLSTGTVVHRARQLWLNAWYKDGNQTKTLHEWCLDASVEESDKVRERYKLQVGCYPNSAQMQTLHESIDFALTMCENYQARYESPIPEGYRFLAAEQKIEVPVPGTEHDCERCEFEGLPKGSIIVEVNPGTSMIVTCPDCKGSGVSLHIFEGKLDGLLQHIATGRIDPLEAKTYGSRPNEHALKTNDQFAGYDCLVRGIGFNRELGSCTVYDGMWRRMEPPRGKTFNDLFMRLVLPERTIGERAEFAKFLPIELNKMYELYLAYANDKNTPLAYTHRRWQGCGDCKMEPLCYAMSRGESTQVLLTEKYTKRSDDVETEATDVE